MVSRNVAIGLMFLSVTTVGILGNFSLLFYYLVHSWNDCKLRSTDMILKHLMIANSLVILSKGIPQIITAFGLKYFLSDFACKLILYIQRVGKSMSIFITCLLSIFQNITISPVNFCWKDLKGRAPKFIGFFISFCWVLYMMVNSIFPLYMLTKWSRKNTTEKRDHGYCYVGHDKITDSIYAALFVFPEVVFSMLMIWSSGSMVLLLYRHKQRVQHIHSIKVSPRSCPESTATQRILVLVGTFVSFYTLSSLLSVHIALFSSWEGWLVNINELISVCFPMVSPFILMSHETTPCTLSRLCFVCIKPTKSCWVLWKTFIIRNLED
ncbi:vomeronasal type-1 receptor 4 [Ictidomys tridecemlineatus]|uniref:vomeronasal type-1 receptor 4-like n=1 Tax=Ictidomys tridecemlineatus TaxID=43179 RepID=UPI00038BBDA1|nr:vomeronasal type-1 receptor 4-like [Ictidomys tridecemlineatus]KAG3255706.1 vomeronasal type-1 receptor 4-like [Ictidomys tridecemlineatus]